MDMRPFPQNYLARAAQKFAERLSLPVFLAALVLCDGGCAAVRSSPSTPPTLAITVILTASSASVLLGNPVTFTATVMNSSDTAVSWSVNGTAGGNAKVGTITTSGLYIAPVDLPESPSVQISATSHADSTKSASATITVQSDITVTITPTVSSVELGAARTFVADVISSSHPDKSVMWSLTGASCSSACGSVDSNGNFTAPQILPSPATVTLVARSNADPSKSAFATITVTSNFALQLAVPSTVAAAATATFIATLTPVPGSNPSTVLTWNLSGSGCSGPSCGALTVSTIRSAGGNASAVSASYSAPTTPPNPDSITVTVTPLANPSKAVQQTFAIQGGGSTGTSVVVSPAVATRAINHRVTLSAQINGTSNTGVTWSVDGSPGGSAANGQICVVGSNPCQVVSSGNLLQVDYVAPSTVPATDPVTVQATSEADTTKSGASQITIINHVLVSVLPGSAELAPLAQQSFAATVLGATNQNVVWQIQGSGCQTTGICGSITPGGLYTAPNSAPSPDALQVVAISSDDTTQSGSANVSIATGASIVTLHPASVYAGAANGFTLKVIGSGFVPTVTGASSTLLIGGTARTTTCGATDECIASVTAADVAIPGNVSVQVQNPDGTQSNAVALVVVLPNVSDEVITLTSDAPSATGNDIIVVEPTTAGVSIPGDDVDLNVGALGAFSTANNSCTLGGNPVTLTRPASGVATTDVCVFSQAGLDSGMTYTVTGPGDVTVIAKQPVGLGIIHLTLQLPATAVPSARTLFVQNTNLDKTAATGTLVIQ